jgi:hypothetical protein
VAPAPDDRTLLRAYEPVLRFTAGELFLPTAVGPYNPSTCGSSSDSWTGARSGAGAGRSGRGCGEPAGSRR